MNLYLIYTGHSGYDTFDSFIVNEKSEEEAKKWTPYDEKEKSVTNYFSEIIHIGKSNKNLEVGIVLTSFNAG